MNNNPILWILLAVGAALLVGVFLLMRPGAPTGPLPAQLLPEAIEGFILVSKEARIDPIFPGEDHSAHASYTPAPSGPWSGKVDHLGIAIFKFKDLTKIGEARKLLIPSGKTETATLGGIAVELAAEEGEAGVFWQDGALLVAILVTAPAGEAADRTTLREAALAAVKAVLALHTAAKRPN